MTEGTLELAPPPVRRGAAAGAIWRALFVVVAGSIAACGGAPAAASKPAASRPAASEAPSREASGELFRFHVDFWANLHQTLYHEALLPRPGFQGPKSLARQSVAPGEALTDDERAAWRDAVGYYDAHFSTETTFSPEFESATRFLSASHGAPGLAPGAIADDWRARLEGAAPAYRRRFWPEHERAGRAFVASLEPALRAHGAWLAHRLETLYGTRWPAQPVDVEVAAVVPPFGASSMGDPPFDPPRAPLITMSSLDPGYAGDASLEMIFHEASHLLIGRTEQALDAAAQRARRPLPRGLWHALLFYTAGRVARERLGPGYVPYAERPSNRIFAGERAPSAALLPVFERAWQPYLDGKTSFEAAIDAVVAAL
jgi:hypothetical protein